MEENYKNVKLETAFNHNQFHRRKDKKINLVSNIKIKSRHIISC